MAQATALNSTGPNLTETTTAPAEPTGHAEAKPSQVEGETEAVRTPGQVPTASAAPPLPEADLFSVALTQSVVQPPVETTQEAAPAQADAPEMSGDTTYPDTTIAVTATPEEPPAPEPAAMEPAAPADPEPVPVVAVDVEAEDRTPEADAPMAATSPDEYVPERSDYDDYMDSDETPSTPAQPARTIFADLGLSEAVLRAIDDMGYRHPTPIQEQAIPSILMNRDVMGVAQTGTGKTASFTLPMLDILTGSRARARMPRSLILEPTRELALQVAENFVEYGKYLKLTHALIIGGESMSDQKDVLMRGVDVLIATPGRLIDMFDRGSILLSDAKLLVIDEADRMLDMGFIPDVERIVSLLPANRQTLFFSATMGPEIRRLADAFLREPKEITVSRPASVATTITEGLALVAEHDKREALRRLIRTQNVQNALIFCNRKVDVDILYKSLTKHQFDVGALHGDMAQTVRFTTLEKFKANELRLLVCSDVAARGLDIGGLSHVFNFDVPHHAEDYVHRIGRTGRAGLEGHAFTIAKPDDRFAIEAIEKLIGHPIPPMRVEGLDPVDWDAGDGRKRRGRGKKAAEPRKAERGKTSTERAPRAPARERPAAMEAAGAETDRPRRTRAPRPEVAAPDVAPPRVEPTRDRAPRRDDARRDDARRDDARRDDARRDDARRDDTRRDDTRRSEPRRDEARRDEPRRDDFRREEPRRDDTRRAEPRRDDFRRERFRRDDDLGPAVLGFGDDVPAFMLLRPRGSRPQETRETEA